MSSGLLEVGVCVTDSYPWLMPTNIHIDQICLFPHLPSGVNHDSDTVWDLC